MNSEMNNAYANADAPPLILSMGSAPPSYENVASHPSLYPRVHVKPRKDSCASQDSSTSQILDILDEQSHLLRGEPIPYPTEPANHPRIRVLRLSTSSSRSEVPSEAGSEQHLLPPVLDAAVLQKAAKKAKKNKRRLPWKRLRPRYLCKIGFVVGVIVFGIICLVILV